MSKTKYKLGDEVHVKWVDSTCKSGWHTSGKPIECHEIVSTGFIVFDNPEYFSLCSDLDPSSGYTARVQSIPKGCVKSVVVRESDCLDKGFFLK